MVLEEDVRPFLSCFSLAQNLDFGVDCDSRVAIVGPNGAGRVALKKSGYAGLDSSGIMKLVVK